jgi:Cu-processing system permease protein
MIGSILTVAHLTLHDARRRRIVTAAIICGVVFVALFATALYLAYREQMNDVTPPSFIQRQATLAAFSLAGLYAANFLSVLFAVLLPVDTLSGEIDSGVMQTIASKPIRRGEIILGKWLGHAVVIGAYLLLLTSGVLIASRLVIGPVLVNLGPAVLLMLLQLLLLMTVTIAGGTRFGTVTNGILALGFYGVAFLGNVLEQVGTIGQIESARTVGIIASLISPTDVLWRIAAYYLQPELVRNIGAAIFSSAVVPSMLTIWWAAGFMVLTLAWAVRSFERRAL